MSKSAGIAAMFVPHEGCPNQCSFCNQTTISNVQSAPTPLEVEAFCEEQKRLHHGKMQLELGFFGGSFTCIEREKMISLLKSAQPYVKDKTFTGIRLSTRPDGLAQETLDLLREYGVTTIEIGAQSMFDEVLQKNRRGHTMEEIVNASNRVKRNDFTLILQMMTGLYGSSKEMDGETARRLADLRPAGVRIYPTAVLKGSLLEQKMKEGAFVPVGLWESVERCAELMDFFQGASITVCRVGLPSSVALEQSVVGGCYHPAFRELCEGALLRCDMERALGALPQGDYTLYVCPKSLSKICGHGQNPLAKFCKMGYNVKIKQKAAIQAWRGFEIE